MSVSARFFVAEVTRFAYNPGATKVVLRASTRGEENKAWSSATPSGTIELNITNPAASEWFEKRIGQDTALVFDDVA